MQFRFAGGLAALSRFADDETHLAPPDTTGVLLPRVNFGEVELLLAAMYC